MKNNNILFNNMTKFIILYLLFSPNYINGTVFRSYLFRQETKTLNCHYIREEKTSSVIGAGETYCSVSCINGISGSCSCSGWRRISDTCKLCYKCVGGTPATSLNVTHIPEPPPDPTKEAAFYQSCDNQAGLPNINAPFAGMAATTTPGKKNNALKLIGTGNAILFSVPITLCRNSFAHCNNGVTFAFWLKIVNNTGWDSRTQFYPFLRTNCLSLEYFNGILRVALENHATGFGKVQNVTMRFNEWVHYGITWDKPSNVMTVYENGALHGTGGDVQGTISRTTYYFQGNVDYDITVDEYYTFEKVMDTQTILLLASV